MNSRKAYKLKTYLSKLWSRRFWVYNINFRPWRHGYHYFIAMIAILSSKMQNFQPTHISNVAYQHRELLDLRYKVADALNIQLFSSDRTYNKNFSQLFHNLFSFHQGSQHISWPWLIRQIFIKNHILKTRQECPQIRNYHSFIN